MKKHYLDYLKHKDNKEEYKEKKKYLTKELKKAAEEMYDEYNSSLVVE